MIQANESEFRFFVPQEYGTNPERFFFTLIDADQFRGSYVKNSFWYRPLNVKKIEIDYGDSRKK